MEFDRFVYRGGLGRLPIGQNLKPPLINNYTPLHSPEGNLYGFCGCKGKAFFFTKRKRNQSY
jgi:hypothetical protein